MGANNGGKLKRSFFFLKGKKVQFSRNIKEKTSRRPYITLQKNAHEDFERRRFKTRSFFVPPNLNICTAAFFITISTIYRPRSFFITKINQNRSLNSSSIERLRIRESNSYLYPITYRAKREIERSISRLTKSRVSACREILESVHGSLCTLCTLAQLCCILIKRCCHVQYKYKYFRGGLSFRCQ